MSNTKYVMSKGVAFGEEEEMEMLSDYASKGWILYKFSFMGYKLKKAKPEKLQYSLDYRYNADEEYFSYFKEAGWNHVCSISNAIHIFSAPEDTKPIYTDSYTKSEKYISQYKLTKKIAVPSFLFLIVCSILFIILLSLAKYNYIPYIYIKIFGIILIPTLIITLVITIFTGLPCISYYTTLNRIKEGSLTHKNHKALKKLLDTLSTIASILVISLFLLSLFNIIIISKAAFFSICLIAIITCLFSMFMK
ncbi:DUF2812 domain-containing protein [Clostridium ljungdahlii]|uniref:DUF2812 domain-containing protein n=1 Tax=Clostridium ljungdahlii TaxID=1538 RepID=A0A168MJQ4_9CLOT|nr:DUF2812 domain-containing protein [Clostridium ljungdahlii]OAA84785.1 hypothetical protein WY13_02688 [Clostridium ljungdahlii]